ncbi:nitronate monooxygenase [Armatimonas rosea]|uniref:NAD(P)H-dependent flavin oxidoreductase YrpB (Nitropropane dioxygenase family) n=1 Tax=Armatimonas rosea TaxID=685828 RepID=A0A7W9SN32_ARMRO|nr:nitronate monooxygenase [Armatimonas rosea]MBB6049013.1 NAD(P)H-dependent flavin oxidoreductase YrpB (nitropropane dioxygenase family) [Armatimonas rosea]
MSSLRLPLVAPIVQAPLGVCDGPRLAAAVSRAGGLGTLTFCAPSVEVTRVRLARLRTLTHRPVLLAFTAEWEKEQVLELCLEQGFRHFQVFWWNGPRLIRRIHAGGGVALWQVGTDGQVEEALHHGADGLVLQGTEAGGQVRSPHTLDDFIPRVRTSVGPAFPLVAGGGLATRSDVQAALARGADAALLGTRFLLTEEALAPRVHKYRLLRAQSHQLELDTRLVGQWPCSPRRRLPTATLPDTPSLYAGEGLSRMHELPTAAAVVRRLSAGL